VLFGRTGETGKSEATISSLNGTYSFSDAGDKDWWDAASNNDPVPDGDYWATVIGGGEHAGERTNLTPVFDDIDEPNGTWTLRISDLCEGDTGEVFAATLDLGGDHAFDGTGVGEIPDGVTHEGGCAPGTPRDVTFNVTGLPATAPADVRITGLALTHPWVGDLTATLIAPDGAATAILFGGTGVKEIDDPEDQGDDSDLDGTYSFADEATWNWWAAAAHAGAIDAIRPGTYRTSTPRGADSPGANTGLTAAFSTLATPNGRWTLRLVDNCGFDGGGEVSAATLELLPRTPGTPTTRDCASLQTALTGAQGKATAAAAALTTAQAALGSAQQAEKVAKASVKKAKKKLKSTRKHDNQAQIKKAAKRLKAAKKRLNAARAALATESAQLTSAQASDTTARAQLRSAETALDACQRG